MDWIDEQEMPFWWLVDSQEKLLRSPSGSLSSQSLLKLKGRPKFRGLGEEEPEENLPGQVSGHFSDHSVGANRSSNYL